MAIIQLIDTVGFNRGGLTKAIYDRLHLASNAGKEVVLIVAGLQFDTKLITDQLKQNGSIPANTKIRSLFDDCFEDSELSPLDFPLSFDETELYKAEEVQENTRLVRYFDQFGKYVGLDNFSRNNIKRFTDFHSSEWTQSITTRVTYDVSGRIRAAKYFDSNWKPRYETIFYSNGNPIYSCWLHENGNRYRIISFNPDAKTAKACSSFFDVRIDFIRKVFEEFPNSLVISDEPSTISFLSKNFDFEIKEGIGFIHTTHDYVKSDGTEPNKPWLSLYSFNTGALSSILTTNDKQASELHQILRDANPSNLFAIYHGTELHSNVSPKNLASGHILFLGRLSDEKRVDLVIKGYAESLKTLPNLVLDIVGDGPLRKPLEELSKSLGVSNSVIFHGYKDDTDYWFKLADCHFLVSKFEGFGLTLIEGLSNACPAIVTPCKYGPNQVINDNGNGLRVDANPKAIAAGIVELYTEKTLKRLSLGALESVQQYSKEQWSEKWMKLFDPY